MTARIAAALREVQWDDLPQRSVYPALHKIASNLAERRTPDSYAESVGRVFTVVAGALGVEPRTAAVGQAIRAAHRKGRLSAALHGVVEEIEAQRQEVAR